jgi:hypothetical protein
MGIARPAGGYAEQMISPGGWPEAEEAAFSARAEEFAGVSRQLGAVLDSSAQQKVRVFEGGIWSGGAANAANGALGRNIDQLTALKSDADDAIRWHNQIAGVIADAKSAITDNVEAANATITALQNDLSLDADERTTAINRVIATTYGANTGVVATTAEQILATRAQKTSPIGRPDPDGQKTPSAEQKTPDPNTSDQKTQDQKTPDQKTPDPNTPDQKTPDETSTPAESSAPDAAKTPDATAGGLPSSLIPPSSADPLPTMPTLDGATPDESNPVPAHGAPVVAPGPSAGTATPGSTGGVGKGLGAASVKSSPVGTMPVASAPNISRPAEDPSAAAPAAAPMSPGAAGGAAAGSGKGSAAPAGTKPAAAATSPGKKMPTVGAGERKGRRQEPEAPDRPAAAAAPAAPIPAAPIPVSAARAERDAIATAITPEAAKRGGADPLALARRIAAALNAPDSDGAEEYDFFWVTAVSTDGAIVVANSYGLAYIPAGVQLPEPVQLVTADADIPAVERARWATYPAMAVQGWAAHHNTKLRAVIATAEQFGGSDPGAAKVVLEPEDIPATGAMAGRSRLEVVDPEAAARLAETADGSLLGLLPPAPAGTSSPPNLRRKLWSDVWIPLTSSVEGREVPHLKAFGPYAALERDTALAEAHSTAEADARRTAVADWLYWRHVGELLASAVGGAQ